MSTPRPVGIEHLAAADTLIDARSPAEYALDHLPGALNCPALSNGEREHVGTLYKQVGAFEARRLGGGLMAANLARHAAGAWADQPAHWKPLVYCWRGGMRSGAMVSWMRMVGWPALQLEGGYKTWRRHVIERITTLSPTLDLRVIAGPTGCGKTRLLHALAQAGASVLDLEGLASHKGSVLGSVPGAPQPAQTAFETRIAQVLMRHPAGQPLWVEAESRRIGRLQLPTPLWERLRASPGITLDVPRAARIGFLREDYAHFCQDPATLLTALDGLSRVQSRDNLSRWRGWAEAGRLHELIDELLALHYDPLYARSHASAPRTAVALGDLSPGALAQAARRLHPSPST